jgi:hypothetical protein
MTPTERSLSTSTRSASRESSTWRRRDGIILDTTDVDSDHAALRDAGIDVDEEVARYGGDIPPMFWLRDPDGNSLCIVQPDA